MARTGAPSRTRYPNAHPTSEPFGCGLNPTALSPPVLQDPPTQHPTSAHQSTPEGNGAHWGAVQDPLPQRAPDFGTVRLRAEPRCPLSNYYHVTRPLADRREGSGVPVPLYSSTPVPQYSSTPVLQYSSTPVPQFSSTPVVQYSSTPVLQFPSTPLLQYPSTPGPANAAPDQRAPEQTRADWRALGRRPGSATPTRPRLRNRSVAG